ncbi:adenosylcobinamide-phosphate synthase CbiB [Cognatishimia maritima]|uniref:Cobalamin biosynthesis protein CobD n=1 Tax=Cognatishimia maritima TaxID=870908 RepID=A0A1M5NEA7_9RHOB|nr:adenosylcobinamide-phosphate synthase CbiB [Cognatishimia maritima]SHG87313.1 adenosylcobinamide-phosphate synthase [Cognatishimia maritima]
MGTATILCLAMLLDAAFGEPKWLWDRLPHPAVLIGRAIGWADRQLNTGDARAKGILLAIGLVLGGWILGSVIEAFGAIFTIVAAAILIAQRSLVDHVKAVGQALRQSEDAGRTEVAKIVGRDTRDMSEADIARAAIESGAENLSDGVIAPIFWFLIAGLPGLLVYKAVNTADSMVGYKNEKYEDFGWASARLDDLLNWVPARLTALLIMASSGQFKGWSDIRDDAALHRSPNAGWPEAAMARVLDIALAGPRSYDGEMQVFPYVNEGGKQALGSNDIDRACTVLWRSWGIMLAIVCLIALN